MWITFGIIKSINYRDKLYQNFKMTDPNSQTYNILKINLKTYNIILKRSIQLQKKLYYEVCFKKYKNYLKKTWKTISEVLNKTK